MNAYRCACGYEAGSPQERADHLGEQFIPADDRVPNSTAPAGSTLAGTVHAEAASDSSTCVCGFTAVIPAGIDAHLLAVFTPPDQIGADGHRHG